MARRGLVLALAAALALPATAHAETAETTADLRCVAVAFAMTSDPKFSSIGMMVALYYLGRLDGRDPDLDLAKKFSDPDALMAGMSVQEAAKSCGEKMSLRGRELKDIAARIEEAERAKGAVKDRKGI